MRLGRALEANHLRSFKPVPNCVLADGFGRSMMRAAVSENRRA
jgi:hypothetical protein